MDGRGQAKAENKAWCRELPYRPAVRTLCLHCREPRFGPWSGNEDRTWAWPTKELKKKKDMLPNLYTA